MWHIQISGDWKISILYNDAHKGLKHGLISLYEYRDFFKDRNEFPQDIETPKEN